MTGFIATVSRVVAVFVTLTTLMKTFLLRLPSQDAATPTLKSVVALLKLGDWDPDVFYKFRDTILNQVYSFVLSDGSADEWLYGISYDNRYVCVRPSLGDHIQCV